MQLPPLSRSYAGHSELSQAVFTSTVPLRAVGTVVVLETLSGLCFHVYLLY